MSGQGVLRKFMVVAAVLLGAGLAPRRAAAGETDGFRLNLSLGWAMMDTATTSGGTGGQGLVLGLGGEERRGRLLFGAGADLGTQVFGRSEVFMGANAGVALGGANEEVGLVAEGGAHLLTNVGGDLLGSSDAPNFWLPYVGVRLDYRPTGPAALHSHFGMSLFVRADLGRRDADVSTCFVGCDTNEYKIGGWMAGMAFRWSFSDWGRRPARAARPRDTDG